MSATTKEILDLNRFDPRRTQGFPADLAKHVTRREASFGSSAVLFYEQPIELVRGEGSYVYDAQGKRYLDVYNNVPSVGHCHPRVVDAIARQTGRLNINTRYLNRIVDDYAERLLATFPNELSNVVLTCTGSESNDLAMRIARLGSGGEGFIVTETAYHGNTALVTEISPSSLRQRRPASFVRTIPAPAARDGLDVEDSFATAVEQAMHDLKANNIKPAALIIDTIFSSDGVYADPPGFLQGAARIIRNAGALLIADEVQPGFGRTGEALWGFMRHGLMPDIVTMGKPMANGFPMGGVVTRPDLLDRFCQETGYFNTFGGNPVAAAAGNAVLDVIEDEHLIEHALHVGSYLKQRLQQAQSIYPEIAEVRGAGLFIGLEFKDTKTGNPNPTLTTHIINQMKQAGILIGAAGKFGTTLKIRPPLCFSQNDADVFAGTLESILANEHPV
jgi:4-aminobutyrate aminotransferase-like enzyme